MTQESAKSIQHRESASSAKLVTTTEQSGAALDNRGFTLIELIVVTAVIGILATMAIPAYNQYSNLSKNTRSIADIRTLSQDVSASYIDKAVYPSSLTEINRGNFLDPWGTPYQYASSSMPGGWTTPLLDELDLRLNYDFDLYSKGLNKDSDSDYVEAKCKDDIARSNDGSYIGHRGPL